MKILILLLVTAIMLPSVTGCIPESALERMSTPLGELALPPLEYNISVAKEATSVMNILETHMANGRNISRGEYPLEREIGNVAHSIKMVDEHIMAVAVLHPPEAETENTAELLRRMHNARNSLELYHDDLVDGKTEAIGGRVNLMRSDFSSLSGMMNP